MRKISFLIDRLFLNKFDRTLVKKLKFINLPWREEQRNRSSEQLTIFIQMPEDYYFLIKFFLAKLVIEGQENRRIQYKFIRITDSQFRKGRFQKIKILKLFDLKWISLYQQLFKGEIVLDYAGSVSKKENEFYENEATSALKKISSKEDLICFRYKGIQIGDLIYDSYLRSECRATVDLSSPELKIIIKSSIRFVEKALDVCNFFGESVLFTGYTSYTNHGIPARVFKKYKKRVFTFSPIGKFLYKEIDGEFISHLKDYPKYVNYKKLLSSDQIQKGITTLKERFSGKIDSSIFYMRNSNYANTSALGEVNYRFNKSVVIYLHCFFDSPHAYRDMSFPDFYQWIETLLKVLNERPVNVFIKKHPNAIEGNDIFLKELVKNYSNIQVLEARVSNIEIAEKIKPICALTIYGTIAYEMAYLGIPVICCGDNPQVDFKFQKTYRNRDEYIHFLKTIEDEVHYHFYHSQSRSEIEAEIGKFLYLHNSGYKENYYHEIEDELNNQLLDIFFQRNNNLKDIRLRRISDQDKASSADEKWLFY